MIKDCVFNDIILYAKGWYQSKDNDIIKDLGYLFSKIYAFTPKTEDDVAQMMMHVLDYIYTEKKVCFNNESPFCYSYFYGEVRDRMHLYNVSFPMAIILNVKSKLFELRNTEIKLKPPHYGKKEHFRLGSTFGNRHPISMTYTEMNRIVQRVFNK